MEIEGLKDDGSSVNVDDKGTVTPSEPAAEQDVAAEMRAAVAEAAPPVKVDTTPLRATPDYQAGDHVDVDPTKPVRLEAKKVPAPDSKAKSDEAAKAADPRAKTEEKKPDAKADDKAAPKSDEKKDDEAAEKKAGDDEIIEVDAEDEEGDGNKAKTDEESDESKKAADADEKKSDDDKKTDAPAEPSETDKLVDELGGVDVLKQVQPLVEAVYDPSLPVSERLDRLEKVMPEAQMKELRNEVFWQAAENPEVQDVLTADADLREVFSQKVFGVPFAYLEKVIGEDKELLGEDGLTEAIAEYLKPEPGAGSRESGKKTETKVDEKKEPVNAAEKKPAAKTVEKKDEPAGPTPEFKAAIIDPLAADVEEVFATGQLEILDTDDAATKQLKADATKAFVEKWPEAAVTDEKMAALWEQIQTLGAQGAIEQAKALYPKFARQARRVAAQLLDEVKAPFKEQGSGAKGQEPAKKDEAKPKPAETKVAPPPAEPKAKAAAKTVDLNALTSADDINRAMQEAMERAS